ncbi:MAG: hypothetical protein Q9M30_01020, partial [Mariprofundaceae bacterium]|nr:hypothetical protein [Mariprofundaceae bacterium]
MICILYVSLCILLCGITPAEALDFGEAGEISGNYRNLLFAGDSPAGHFVQTDSNRLRLQWDSRQWGQVGGNGALTAHLAYDNELFGGGLVSTPAFRAASLLPQATWADGEQTVLRRGRMFWRHTLYRGWVNWDDGNTQLRLGRQRIAWGSGRMWNPTDRFNPVDPTALEADQKIGVDSALGEWRYSSSGVIQIVAAPGRGARRVSRKAALRARDTFGETDVALLAGRMGSETVYGLDMAANVLDGGLHGEMLHARPQGKASYSQLSSGYEYTLTNRIFPQGLYLLGEYFFNGAAQRVLPGAGDRLNSRVRHLFGLSAGYDLTPMLRLQFSAILDPVKGSVFAAPRLSWSLAENIDLAAFW